MAENSKIEWTDHTQNFWRGCTKVSPECDNCYAEAMSHRNPKTLGEWGPMGKRIVAADATWREPLKWDKKADKDLRYFHERPYTPRPKRPRVFCSSLSDVLERWDGAMTAHTGEQLWCAGEGWTTTPGGRTLHMTDVRRQMFKTINATPRLDWLLLTKRPENARDMLPDRWLDIHWPDNVWMGTSVGNRKATKRIDILRTIPARIRFLSVEPLLEDLGQLDLTGIHWVIVGGESGHGARRCRVDWVRDIARQCAAAGVPCFVKQLGANVVTRNDMIEDVFNNGKCGWPDPEVEHDINGFREHYQGADCRIRLSDKKGGDWSEWPEDLRVREFPGAAT